MKRDCPTIQELLAFDTVARYASVTQAADVLCLTVSAVSKQLAGLEQFVGVPLLEKSGRGLRLTPQGQAYWRKVSDGVRIIEAATFEMRAARQGAGLLTLASVPTFLTKWLIPRLPGFRQRHPGITLSFSQHLAVNEPLPAGVDVAIRYGDGDWPGVVSDYIAGREFVLVGAPALFGSSGQPVAPADLAGQTLLHHAEAPSAWRLWAQQHGVKGLHDRTGPRFAQYSAMIQAAATGLGVALIPRILVLDELASSALVSPCGDPVVVGQAHYLCYRRDAPLETPLAAFRGWILEQAQASGEVIAKPPATDAAAVSRAP